MSRVELTLKGKPPFRRVLDLAASPHYLSVALYAHTQRRNLSKGPMLAWMNGELSESRLVHEYGEFCLWIGSAAFGVSAAEAKQIRELFEPLGLRFVKVEPMGLAGVAP